MASFVRLAIVEQDLGSANSDYLMISMTSGLTNFVFTRSLQKKACRGPAAANAMRHCSALQMRQG